jgi:DnaK suppressor protein
MARKDALLRLHKSLLNRRAELLKRLGVDLQDLDHTRMASGAGDIADAAFDSGSEEIASQLAEFEARELRQIQRALIRLKAGAYGLCEVCHAKIPVARLNALPYSTMCIRCQREIENDSGWLDSHRFASWDKISDVEPRLEDRKEIGLADIEMDLTK